MELGVPEWGVAALYEKAWCFDHFVASFKAVQIPKKYDPDQRAEVEKDLKTIEGQLVLPIETKSAEILKTCVQKAAEFHVISNYVGKCHEKLARPGSQELSPSGLVPQPSYWTLRWIGKEVARP